MKGWYKISSNIAIYHYWAESFKTLVSMGRTYKEIGYLIIIGELMFKWTSHIASMIFLIQIIKVRRGNRVQDRQVAVLGQHKELEVEVYGQYKEESVVISVQ